MAKTNQESFTSDYQKEEERMDVHDAYLSGAGSVSLEGPGVLHHWLMRLAHQPSVGLDLLRDSEGRHDENQTSHPFSTF